MQVNQAPFQVVQSVVDQRWAFAVRHCPSEQESDEDPPLRPDERAEIFPIDGFLGVYTPEQQQITIFSKGIARAAELLDLEVSDVTMTVRLHEWAHALIHVGLSEQDRLRVTQDESLWPDMLATATASFHRFDRGLHERLAQLLVHHGLRSMRAAATAPEAVAILDRRTRAFERLTQHSPTDYRIDRYLSLGRERIVESIYLLKSGGIVSLAAWDTVVTW